MSLGKCEHATRRPRVTPSRQSCCDSLVYGIAQLVAALAGLGHHLGPVWAVVILAATLTFRFTLPVTVGALLGATNVWGCHWLGALVFAMPGLVFVVPAVPSAVLGSLGRSKA